LPAAVRERLKLASENGALLISVEPEGPAAQAGLMLGDVLLALDGQPIRDTDDIQAHLGAEKVGKEVAASILRGGALTQAAIRVGARPRRGR
jgi:S1-C subfamily serine protease